MTGWKGRGVKGKLGEGGERAVKAERNGMQEIQSCENDLWKSFFIEEVFKKKRLGLW